MMEIHLATDHAGFEMKEDVREFLVSLGIYKVKDWGAYKLNKKDHFTAYVPLAADAVSKDPENRRLIIFGGSGEGEAMAANRFDHVRTAVFYGLVIPIAAVDISGRESDDLYEIVKLSRKHNDANGLSIAARFVTIEQAINAVAIWLKEPFSGDPRHVARIKAMDEMAVELRGR